MFADKQDIFQQKGICSQRGKTNKVCICWKNKTKQPKSTQYDHFSSCFKDNKRGKAVMQYFLTIWKLSTETDGGKKQGMISTD